MSDEKKKLETVTVGELLSEGTTNELEARDGEWSAFTASVFRRLDSGDLGHSRLSYEDQAINLFRAEVESEVSAMAPRFEEAFKEGVERRIFASAKAEPNFWARARAWLAELSRPQMGLRVAGALAASAFVTLAVVRPWETAEVEASLGEVSVESVAFEGTVTVVPEGAVTIIWLAEGAS